MKVDGKWIKGAVSSTGYVSSPYKACAEYEKQYQKYFKTKEEAVEYLKRLYEEHGSPPPYAALRISEQKQSDIPFGQGQSQICALLRALRPRGK